MRKTMERATIIGVIGASQPTPSGYAAALEVGRRIARGGGVLVCGGLGGVMEAASRGSAEQEGLVLGILPGPEPSEANPFVTLAVPTNMGHARNVIIAHTARVLIAVEGSFGTLSEMAVALKLGRPVIGLRSPYDLPGLLRAESPEEAVRLAFETVSG